MDDQFGKYIRLAGSIFFMFVGILLSLFLLLLAAKLFFGLLSYLPWINYVYMAFILIIPASLFITCYLIYFKRTASHPNRMVRWISYFLFSSVMIAWLIYLVQDIMIFYKHAYNAIGMYYSYDMLFLALNVACIFIVGILQALTTEKEKDWMDRGKQNV